MHRFVAVAWDPASPPAREAAQAWLTKLRQDAGPWRVVLRRDGIEVFLPKDSGAFTTLNDLLNPSGVVIGRLFERGYEKQGRLGALSKSASRLVERTLGDDLVKNYWGSYVAIWHDAERGHVAIQRDPSGAVPVFRHSNKGADLFFAHAEDTRALGLKQLSINWDRVRAFLHHNYFTTESTGISEITELAAGKRLVLKRGSAESEQWCWNAASIAAEPDMRDVSEIEAELREVVTSCFTALATQFSRTLVQLSGGLDSSILLALLRKAPTGEIYALHTVAEGYEAYEAELARMMAVHTNTPFIAKNLADSDGDLRSILAIPLLTRPDRQIMGAPGNALIESVCTELNIDAVMAGHGGDSLFLQRSAAAHTLPDYIRLNGWTPEVMNVAYDAAMLEERSVWAVLKGAMSALKSRAEWDPYAFLSQSPSGNGLPESSRDEAIEPKHPWLESAKTLPPGKATQVSYLVGMYNYYLQLGYGLSREAVDPYLSQPIIEFALRIPTYQFSRGGTDRSLQRRTFGDLLPSPIRRRTGKGFVNNFLLKGIEQNSVFLRELLHEGELVRQGMLRRDAIDPMFSHESLVDGSALTMINSLSATEAWLQSWRKTGAVAA